MLWDGGCCRLAVFGSFSSLTRMCASGWPYPAAFLEAASSSCCCCCSMCAVEYCGGSRSADSGNCRGVKALGREKYECSSISSNEGRDSGLVCSTCRMRFLACSQMGMWSGNTKELARNAANSQNSSTNSRPRGVSRAGRSGSASAPICCCTRAARSGDGRRTSTPASSASQSRSGPRRSTPPPSRAPAWW